jgi:WD40 repeat protein
VLVITTELIAVVDPTADQLSVLGQLGHNEISVGTSDFPANACWAVGTHEGAVYRAGIGQTDPVRVNLHGGQVRALTFLNNGALLAGTAEANPVQISSSGQLMSWPDVDKPILAAAGVGSNVAVTGDGDGRLYFTNLNTKAVEATERNPQMTSSCVCDAGRLALCGLADGHVELRSFHDRSVHWRIKKHASYVSDVAVDEADDLGASVSIDGTLELFQLNSGKRVSSFKVMTAGLQSAAFQPGVGDLYVSGIPSLIYRLPRNGQTVDASA